MSRMDMLPRSSSSDSDSDNDIVASSSSPQQPAFSVQELRERRRAAFGRQPATSSSTAVSSTLQSQPEILTPQMADSTTLIAGTSSSPPPAVVSSPASVKGKERAVNQDGTVLEGVSDPTVTEVKPELPAASDHSPFACHICLETPASDDCVVTRCGHLFCWSDISAWLDSDPPRTSSCPVCKSAIKDTQEDIFPIYSGGTDSKKQIDPRTKPRPKPKVEAAPPLARPGGFGLFDNGGWQIQAGMFLPGLSLGWSNAPRMQPFMNPRLFPGAPPVTPQQQAAAQEQARVQQRNALIAFAVMIVLFSILATIEDMDY
ncbi:hypothetical protein EMMF5_000064 [Cystobasidiomycetes sp. EMM_F5]